MNARAVLDAVHWTRNQIELNAFFTGASWGGTGLKQPDPDCHHVVQVHGTRVVAAQAETAPRSTQRPEADGLWTAESNLVIGVKTADCLPILLADRAGRVAAVVHAGWRGLTAGILPEAIRILASRVPETSLQMLIGPAIGPGKFEVGPEVVDALARPNMNLREDLSWCLTKGTGDRWFADLAVAAVLQATQCGLAPSSMAVWRVCTFEGRENWHSYRRDGRTGGRNWTWIALRARG